MSLQRSRETFSGIFGHAKEKITQTRQISTFIYKENKLFSLYLKKVLAVFNR